jgi:maltose alpha-D-glucosyltransferase/alpha-amylase
MQTLVREVFQQIEPSKNQLSIDAKMEIESLSGKKDDILNLLKKIYTKKLDIIRTRVHGSYHLENILLTGKDISIQNFGGDISRNYSEQRIKRSPLFDVAYMIRSFYYIAHEGFSGSTHIPKETLQQLLPFAWTWAYYISGFFMKAYLQTVTDSRIIPPGKDDLEMLLQVFLLERALYALNYELINRPGKTIVPLNLIYSILNVDKNQENENSKH